MKLREYLQTRGITYKSFGEAIGRTGTSVYRYATARSTPDDETMMAINYVTNGAVQPNDFYDLPSGER